MGWDGGVGDGHWDFLQETNLNPDFDSVYIHFLHAFRRPHPPSQFPFIYQHLLDPVLRLHTIPFGCYPLLATCANCTMLVGGHVSPDNPESKRLARRGNFRWRVIWGY